MILVTQKPDVKIFQRIVTITIIALLIVVIQSPAVKMSQSLITGVLTTVLVQTINVTQKRDVVLMNTFHVMIRIYVPLTDVTQYSVALTPKSLATITLSVLSIVVNLILVARILL
jgi:hypothetical protein